MKKTFLTDVDAFKFYFGLDVHREKPGKLEYRVQNLDLQLQIARKVIADHKLKLQAVTEGSMSQIRAFYVKEVANG